MKTQKSCGEFSIILQGIAGANDVFQLLTCVLDGFLEFRILGVDEINCGSGGSNKNKTKFACTIPRKPFRTISGVFGIN